MTPKLYIHSADISGNSDGTVTRQILEHLPNKAGSVAEADVIIVPVSYMHNFQFDQRLYNVPAHKICVLDFLEFGWNWGDRDSRMGYGLMAQCGHLNTPEYAKLDQWIKDSPPRLTLKRELLKAHVSESMQPIEFLCMTPAGKLQERAQFDARPFDLFNCFGLSNPLRFQLHAEIFAGAHDHGYNVVDKWSMEQHLEKRNFVSIFTPWQVRKHIKEVMRWQRRAKISISLPGAGVKCFRSGESPVDSIMALPHDLMAWGIPWNDGENCIRIRPDHMLADLLDALASFSLYDIYRASQDTIDRYRSGRYVNEYLMPLISSRI